MRWGILATGGIARSFTRDLLARGHRVSAVASRSRDRAQAFADEFGIPRAHGSYDDLVADSEVDVVYVATPHSAHAENALTALANGKHVRGTNTASVLGTEGRMDIEPVWYGPTAVNVCGVEGEVRSGSSSQ